MASPTKTSLCFSDLGGQKIARQLIALSPLEAPLVHQQRLGGYLFC